MRALVLPLVAALLTACPAVREEDPEKITIPERPPGPSTQVLSSSSSDATGRFATSPETSAALHTLAVVELATREIKAIDAIPEPHAATFWPAGAGLGLDALSVIVGGTEISTLVAYDLGASRVVFRRDVSTRSDDRLPEVFRTASRVVVKTSFEVALVDGATGAWAGRFVSPSERIQTVVAVPPSGRLVVVTASRLLVLDEADASVRCSLARRGPSPSPDLAHAAVAVANGRAFVGVASPGLTAHLTVIDAASCRLESLLQGGVLPRAIGGSIVALADRYGASPDAAPLPAEVLASPVRFHVAFTDPRTLAQTFAPLSDDVFAHVGNEGVKFSVFLGIREAHAIDVPARTVKRFPLARPTRALAVGGDGRHVFGASQGFVDVLDLEEGTSEPIPFSAPVLRALTFPGFDGAVLEHGGLTLLTREPRSLTKLELPKLP